MKIRLLWMLFIVFIVTPYGCTLLIPKHATKTKAEFYAEKKDCDKESRTYYQTRNIVDSDSEVATRSLEYSRRCLKEKGWHYF
jgi:hypothetical protein